MKKFVLILISLLYLSGCSTDVVIDEIVKEESTMNVREQSELNMVMEVDTQKTNLNEILNDETKNDNNSTKNVEEQYDMIIKVEPQEININEIPDFIKAIVTNLSDIDYHGSWHCGIQYYDGNDWMLANAPAFIDESVAIEAGGILEINVPLYPNWFPLLPTDYVHDYTIGKYRVKYGEWYGEFTITE